jgi:opine dehydrogenase
MNFLVRTLILNRWHFLFGQDYLSIAVPNTINNANTSLSGIKLLPLAARHNTAPNDFTPSNSALNDLTEGASGFALANPNVCVEGHSAQVFELTDTHKIADIGIVGFGNTARALGSYLSHQGHRVRFLVRNIDRFSRVRESKSLSVQGYINGQYDICDLVDDCVSFLANCDTIFIATVTTDYEALFEKLSPHLRDGQTIILFSSKFAGSRFVDRIVKRHTKAQVNVLETDALFASRVLEDDTVWIRGFKRWTLFSSVNKSLTAALSSKLNDFFPDLQPAENIIQRGLTDFGALAHPITMIANLSAIDRAEPFLFYYEGFSERTIVLMEQMESEFVKVAQAYNTSLIPFAKLLDCYYGCNTDSLLSAMQSVPNYRHSQAPSTLTHRYIIEDVASSLIPVRGLAHKAGMHVPLLDSVVNMSLALLQDNILPLERSLEKLGWQNMSVDEIVREISQ